jgi:hypothetical protein
MPRPQTIKIRLNAQPGVVKGRDPDKHLIDCAQNHLNNFPCSTFITHFFIQTLQIRLRHAVYFIYSQQLIKSSAENLIIQTSPAISYFFYFK